MSENQSSRAAGRPTLAALTTLWMLGHAAAAYSSATEAPASAPASWLDRLHLDDRAPLEAWISYLPPNFDSSLRWIPEVERNESDTAVSWEPYRGKIVLVQSWSITNADSTRRLNEVANVVEEFSEIDVQLIALHTPQDAEEAVALVQGVDGPHAVVIDTSGSFCDMLGIYRTPVNLVIGRNGAVRYAGLTPDGVRAAIDALLDEDPVTAPCAGSRPIGVEAQVPADTVDFPPPLGGQLRAADLRGQRAPDFHVSTWITPEPARIGGQVTVIEFFAAWCGHCINAIPHLNSLASRFADRASIIAISDEAPETFHQNLQRRQRSVDGFDFHVALDSDGRMKNVFRPAGVPSAAVLDSDWIVRWQGHPAQLTDATLDQIVRADASRRGTSALVKRWRTERESGAIVEPRRAAADSPTRQPATEQPRRDRPTPDGFPPIVGDTAPAVDFRGRTGPEFHVESWISEKPRNLGENVTVIELFGVWCPHCRNAIPKMNDLQKRFGERVNIVAISDETPQRFNENLARNRLSAQSWSHPLALDPTNRIKSAVRPRGVPYAMVLGSDWVVRWQGHPAHLTEPLLEQIIRADEARRDGATARR